MMKRLNKRFLFLSIPLLFISYFIYKYSPYKLDYIGYYDKIWAHRVDSEPKLKAATLFFKGVEVDLVYNKEQNYLDVGHPPVKSIHLSFDEYLSKLNNKKPYIWLDIKNLTDNNATKIYLLIERLRKRHQYSKNKFLIETKHPQALDIFIKNNYKCLYYLPYELHKKNKTELNKTILHIHKILKSKPKLGISATYKDYPILHKNFSDKNKYIWITERFKQRKFRLTRKILKDTTVKVVLISFHAIRGNR